jgi:hypothetical protein
VDVDEAKALAKILKAQDKANKGLKPDADDDKDSVTAPKAASSTPTPRTTAGARPPATGWRNTNGNTAFFNAAVATAAANQQQRQRPNRSSFFAPATRAPTAARTTPSARPPRASAAPTATSSSTRARPQQDFRLDNAPPGTYATRHLNAGPTTN